LSPWKRGKLRRKSSGALWLQPFEIFSQSWRTVTYDHRGTGLTTSVPDDITWQGLVDDLFAVMDALEIETCVLTGESSGVLVALGAYFAHPDRFDGLVLVDGYPGSSAGRSNDGRLTAMRLDWPRYWSDFVDNCVTEPDVDHIRRWARRIERGRIVRMERGSPRSLVE
jgi:pimeloyl-ACP methyl ester carboxylesterase